MTEEAVVLVEEGLYAGRWALAWTMGEGFFGNEGEIIIPNRKTALGMKRRRFERERERNDKINFCVKESLFLFTAGGVTICAPHDRISHRFLVEILRRQRTPK